MFTNNGWGSEWAIGSRRRWATLTSFIVQTVGVALLLAIPLLYTEGLPKLRLISEALPAVPPGRAPDIPVARGSRQVVGKFRDGIFSPPRIPSGINPEDGHRILPDSGAPSVDGSVGTSQGADPNGVLNSILSAVNRPAPPVPHATAPVVRTSRMMEGFLVHRVQPVYPPLAKAARIQGTVELQAVISREGRIERLEVVKGPPMLIRAAIDAVQQWRYRPYVLNGEPMEVETHITINFTLSGG